MGSTSGCGLGDIIRRVNSKNKLCLDIDKRVLSACKFLSLFNNVGGSIANTNFEVYDFFVDDISEKYDAIIMVNWIASVNTDTLKEQVTKLFRENLNSSGYLIFDVLTKSLNKINHDPAYLIENLNCKVEYSTGYKYGRTLVFLEKQKPI